MNKDGTQMLFVPAKYRNTVTMLMAITKATTASHDVATQMLRFCANWYERSRAVLSEITAITSLTLASIGSSVRISSAEAAGRIASLAAIAS